MVVYIISPKNSTRELLHLINNFPKMAGYEIIGLKKKFGKKHPLQQSKKKIKYLLVTLTKQMKYLYEEKFKSFKKKK